MYSAHIPPQPPELITGHKKVHSRPQQDPLNAPLPRKSVRPPTLNTEKQLGKRGDKSITASWRTQCRHHHRKATSRRTDSCPCREKCNGLLVVTLAIKAADPYLCFNVRQPGGDDRTLISSAMLHAVSRGLQLFWALSLSWISQFFVSTFKRAAATPSDFRPQVFTIKAQPSNQDFGHKNE